MILIIKNVTPDQFARLAKFVDEPNLYAKAWFEKPYQAFHSLRDEPRNISKDARSAGWDKLVQILSVKQTEDVRTMLDIKLEIIDEFDCEGTTTKLDETGKDQMSENAVRLRKLGGGIQPEIKTPLSVLAAVFKTVDRFPG